MNRAFILAVRANIAGSEDCILWTGPIADKDTGYGRMGWNRRLIYAHRALYEVIVADIPEGLTIDHLCRTRLCVNVRHMECVTLRENQARALNPASLNRQKTHCVYGHPFDEANTRRSRGRRYCIACLTRDNRRRSAERSAARRAALEQAS